MELNMKTLTTQEIGKVSGGSIDTVTEGFNRGTAYGSVIGYARVGALRGALRGGLTGGLLGASFGAGWGLGSYLYNEHLSNR